MNSRILTNSSCSKVYQMHPSYLHLNTDHSGCCMNEHCFTLCAASVTDEKVKLTSGSTDVTVVNGNTIISLHGWLCWSHVNSQSTQSFSEKQHKEGLDDICKNQMYHEETTLQVQMIWAAKLFSVCVSRNHNFAMCPLCSNILNIIMISNDKMTTKLSHFTLPSI